MNGSDLITIFFLSLLPLIEARLAFPIGLYVFGLNPWISFGVTLLGSVIVVIVLYQIFMPLFQWLERHWRWLHHFLEHRLRALAAKHEQAYQRFGAIFLFFFVAAPIPGTGIWSAVPLAILFGTKPRLSAPAILLGSIVAEYLAAFLTGGFLSVF